MTPSFRNKKITIVRIPRDAIRFYFMHEENFNNMLQNTPYTHFANLAQEVAPPADGILSRTLYQNEQVKVVLFGFSAGQELSEHTASKPAIIQMIHGEARLTLGDDVVAAQPGAWIYMPPNLKHSVHAQTPAVLLLLLIKA